MEPVFSSPGARGPGSFAPRLPRMTHLGMEHIPCTGAAVSALDHTDFLPAIRTTR